MRIVGNQGPRMRLVTAMLLVIATASTVLPGSVAAQDESPADRAAREIQEARDQANAAADAYFQAESTLDQLEDDLASLIVEEGRLQETVDELRAQVEVVALGRYIASGTEGIPLLTDVSEPQDQIQADVFTDVLTNTGADALDEYDAAEKALLEKQDEVADRQDEVEAQREEFADLEEAALGEVERLREIEQERLQDEAVQRALEARLAAERAEVEERARLDAEAAARAQPNPGLVVPPSTEAPAETTTTTIDPNAPVPTDANGDAVPVTEPAPPPS
ncbi:MAG: hypothetical protein ABJ382_01135, partial [Ilumatobacter sp.]